MKAVAQNEPKREVVGLSYSVCCEHLLFNIERTADAFLNLMILRIQHYPNFTEHSLYKFKSSSLLCAPLAVAISCFDKKTLFVLLPWQTSHQRQDEIGEPQLRIPPHFLGLTAHN